MSHGHTITQCRHCGIVIGQCRCTAPMKKVEWAECFQCRLDSRTDEAAAVANGDLQNDQERQPPLSFVALRAANLRRCDSSYHPVTHWSLSDWMSAVAGELGELAEEVKGSFYLQELLTACTGSVGALASAVKNLRRKETEASSAHTIPSVNKDAIAKEAADIVIYLDLLCARAGIDLGEAVRGKFNEVSDRVGSDEKL